MADEIVLYRSIASRSVVALWMLEELGLSYRMETFDIRKGETRSPAYLAINPHGRVPMLVDGDIKITETAAICLHLADRYGSGTLAPRLDEAARGPYTSWIVWATAVLEPASALAGREVPEKRQGDWQFGFGAIADELEPLRAAVEGPGRWLLGERFSAADVMVGAVVSMRLFTGELPRHDWLVAYGDRCQARPAFKRAGELNWPPELFANVKPAP
jgi:glutathione S-transferase